jgi:hypothetical protein
MGTTNSSSKIIMKPIIMKLAGWVAGLCVSSLLAQGAPLQRPDVIASPAWLLHLDCDRLRTTAVGQYILTEMDQPEAKAKLAALQTIFDFDLRTQLHGLTLYGTSVAPEDGVLMVYADFNADRLLLLARAAKDYQSTPHNQHVIHSWLDEKKPAKNGVKPRVFAAIQGNRVIFSQREAGVATALDVLDGTTPNLAAGQLFPNLGRPGTTEVIEAGAGKLNLPDSDPNATIMKLAQNIQLQVGEQQQQCLGTITLLTDNEQVATHVLQIAQGILFLTKMQTDNPERTQLANALSLSQDGASVVGHLALSSADLVKIMQADAAPKAAAAASKDASQ